MLYKVMIIEDEDMIRKGLKFGFDWQSLSCHVVADTHDAKEALILIDKYKPDILVADINLPVMSGLKIIEKTIDKYGYSPIIISGYSDFSYAQRAIQLGVISYISKPIDHSLLTQAVKMAIQDQKDKKIIDQNNPTLESKNLIQEDYKKIISDELVKEIITIIEKRYSESILLVDLALEVGYSESTINTRLKKSLGTTFNQFLNQYRIHRAIIELNDDPLTHLEELGARVGIPSYKHFSRLFRRHTGYSPQQFAVNIQNEF